MEIKEIRKKIDGIDDKMVSLYYERMKLCGEIAGVKAESGKPINDAAREKEIIYRLSEKVPKEMTLYVKELYETVFFTSKAYQSVKAGKTSATLEKITETLKSGLAAFPVSATVACQGIAGANSGVAATKIFPVCDTVYVKNFAGVFGAVESGLCEYGVLPIENSTAGSVLEVYDLMKKHNFHIVRSLRLRINHCLAAIPSAKISDVKKIISHPQALSQCDGFIKEFGAMPENAENTAVAAKFVADSGDKTIACICSAACAESYGLKILKNNIEDSDANYTRFICISKDLRIFKGADRISVMTSLSHEPGSLNKILGKFAALGLNLTKLESRPIVGADFEFMFYFDFEGDITDGSVQNIISELENGSDNFVFLGAYKEKI